MLRSVRGPSDKHLVRVSAKTTFLLVISYALGMALFHSVERPVGLLLDASRLELSLGQYERIPRECLALIKARVFAGRQVDRYAVVVTYEFASKVMRVARSNPELLCRELSISAERVQGLMERIQASANPLHDPLVLEFLFAQDEFASKLAERILHMIGLSYGGHEARFSSRMPARPWLCITRCMVTVLSLREHSGTPDVRRYVSEILRTVGHVEQLSPESIEQILRVIMLEDTGYENQSHTCQPCKAKWLRARVANVLQLLESTPNAGGADCKC